MPKQDLTFEGLLSPFNGTLGSYVETRSPKAYFIPGKIWDQCALKHIA